MHIGGFGVLVIIFLLLVILVNLVTKFFEFIAHLYINSLFFFYLLSIFIKIYFLEVVLSSDFFYQKYRMKVLTWWLYKKLRKVKFYDFILIGKVVKNWLICTTLFACFYSSDITFPPPPKPPNSTYPFYTLNLPLNEYELFLCNVVQIILVCYE